MEEVFKRMGPASGSGGTCHCIFIKGCFYAGIGALWLHAPTIQKNSVLFCTYIHDVSKVERGQILVFESDELGKTLIKRLIGLPGETVSIREDGSIAVDGQVLDESYVVYPQMGEEMEFEVPQGQYLFLGDNRAGSEDARYWDEPFIAAEKIKARARFTLWPFQNFGGLR